MSARWQRSEARPEPPVEEMDPFEDLGPGDPGYRLRGGRTGFDPFETTLEQARINGLVLRWALRRWYLRAPLIVLFVALIVQLVLEGAVMALVLIGAIAVAVFLVWLISSDDLARIRSQRRRN
jgi:hypothetical protein